jgi:hypothetical protein
MWDTVETTGTSLSHDLPCFRCGHAAHTYLPCSDTCDCEPVEMPGEPPLIRRSRQEIATAA